MKKLLFLAVLLGIFIIGYLLGGGNTAEFPSEQKLRDLATEASVRTAIGLNKHLDGSRIEVTIQDGQVELRGTVPSAGHRQLAEEIAGGIQGVRTVSNDLTIEPTSQTAASPPERSLGQRLDDLTATARVKTAFALHRDIQQGDVSVRVLNGEASLTGTVPNWAARELAAKVAEDVEGVQRVHNQLRVWPDGAGNAPPDASTPEQPAAPPAEETTPVQRQVADGSIRLQVEAALNVNPFIDARRVHVVVENAQVTLTGTVRSATDRALIQKIVEDCWGVEGVTNDIQVEAAPARPLQYAPAPDAARTPVLPQ